VVFEDWQESVGRSRVEAGSGLSGLAGVFHSAERWGWAVSGAVVIKWYRVSQWGCAREFVHPESAGDAAILLQLTGKRTITGAVRELVRDLSRGAVQWQEVIAPNAGNMGLDDAVVAAVREARAGL
jgi:hypothetical protein